MIRRDPSPVLSRLRPTPCVLLGLAGLLVLSGAAAAQTDGGPPPLLEPLSHGRTLELPELDPSVPSPAELLGYSLGDRFTHHPKILETLEALAEASPRVTLWTYGETYEGRPLTLVAISSAANVARLEEIRTRHLRLADPRGLSTDERERLLAETPVVAWLAYGVHGNESSSSEAALAAAYVLAAARGEWEELLDETVVLVDPLVNPDGRERYVSGYEQRRGRVPDPDPAAAEHREPWPGGRQNHYLIDLNRDWAWASQRETRHRLAAYRRWEPQVFVDYHEMYAESSYFFPPSADPVNPYLDERTVGWLDVFGRANAAAFDRQGWPYFKGEAFDLFYPGYGDAYPAFRGAVGMTYEMAGHGRAGLVMELRDGTLLTLADRIARHTTTSLSTVRAAAENRRALLEDFTAARADAADRPGPAYLWPAEAPEAEALAETLGRHGVEVGRLADEARLPVRPLTADADAEPERRSFPAGTYAVHAGQPLGNLVQTLLDRSTRIGEAYLERQRERLERNLGTEFYDITAWSLPLAFNLDAWVVPEPPADLGRSGSEAPTGASESSHADAAPARSGAGDDRGVGYLVPPDGLDGYRFAAALVRRELDFRVALEEFEVGGSAYPAGTLFIPRLANRERLARDRRQRHETDADAGDETLRELVERLARDTGVRVDRAETFYSTRGVSLGSDLVPTVHAPRIGLLAGAGVSPTSFGYLWHLLDREVELPHSRLDLDRLGAVDLDAFDVLVLPDGWRYDASLSESAAEDLGRWVREGGVLVAVGAAHGWLRERELTAVEEWKPEPDGDGGASGSEEDALADRRIQTPGAIVATEATAGHPLLLGLPSSPPVLVTGATVLLPTGDPQVDVLRAVAEEPILAGVAWPEAVERLSGSLLVSVERQGGGLVILFAQEPDFRRFWRGTAPLFLNSVLYGPTLTGGGRY